MRIAYEKLQTINFLGFKLFDIKTRYSEYSKEDDKPFDKIFIEKTSRYIESNN